MGVILFSEQSQKARSIIQSGELSGLTTRKADSFVSDLDQFLNQDGTGLNRCLVILEQHNKELFSLIYRILAAGWEHQLAFIVLDVDVEVIGLAQHAARCGIQLFHSGETNEALEWVLTKAEAAFSV